MRKVLPTRSLHLKSLTRNGRSRRAFRPLVQMVERRVLLSTATITEYPTLPPYTPSNSYQNLTVGPDGNLWFDGGSNDVVTFNTTTHAYTEIVLPDRAPGDLSIISGPLGDIWVTEFSYSEIVQIDPTTDSIVAQYHSTNIPDQLVALPDGDIWFSNYGTTTDESEQGIGVLDPSTGDINLYPLPSAETAVSITAAADGNLWYTDTLSNSIGLFNTTTHQVREFPIPTAHSNPIEMTVGPDGNVWFVESSYTAQTIGELNTVTDQIQDFALPGGSGGPYDIVPAADGDLWFTVFRPGVVGSINPTTDVISTYPVPDSNAAVTGIAATPDGNLWFLDNQEGVGELTPPPVIGTQLVVQDEPASSVNVGAGIGLTVAVEDSADNIDTSFNGTVTVSLGNNPGGATLGGTLTAKAVNGVATFSGLTLNEPGNGYSLTLSADGIAPEPAVLAPATTSAIDVAANTTTTSVSLSSSATVVGKPVTITATVATPASDTLSPSGVVTFVAGITEIGTGTLSTTGSVTTASVTFTPTAAGVLSISAAYGGDSGDDASLAVSSLTVGQDSTTTSISALPSSAVYGQSVTLSATIAVTAPGVGIPTGLATFLDGTETLGTGTLSTVAGVSTATFTTTGLSAITHMITAEYGGDANDTSSTSGTVEVGVTPASAALTLGSLSFTYNGTSQGTTAITSPVGITGVMLAYSLNGASVAAPVAAGSYTVTASLSNSNFTASPVTGTLVIGQATPVITWDAPAPLVYGAVLTATQLDASASIMAGGSSINVPGQFVYSDPVGTVLNAGNDQALSVSFIPTDMNDFTGAENSTTISITKAAPLLAWSPPLKIVYGTALSSTQLDATSSIDGTFAYQSASGTILNAGAGQTLTATFTPTDSVDYASGTVSTTIDVSPAPLTVTAADANGTAGQTLPDFSATTLGFVDGQGPGVLGGTLSFSTSASLSSPAGTYAIVPGGLVSSNYAITYVDGTLTLQPSVTTQSLAPPLVAVTGLQWEKVKVSHKKTVEELVVKLNGSLNAADAVNLRAYSLDLGKKVKRVGVQYTKVVPLTSVSYNAGAEEVILTLRGSLPSGTTQLTINSSLIRDSSGRPLSGGGGGQANGNFVALLNR